MPLTLNQKHNLTLATLQYGSSYYPIEQANLIRFPQRMDFDSISLLNEEVECAISKLSGNFTLKTLRVTAHTDGIMFEGEGWRVQYGKPLLSTIFPHNIANSQLPEFARERADAFK